MNYLDAIIAVPLIWGAYKGFQRGFIFEIAMIIGLVLGLYIAFKFSVFFEGLIGKYVTGNASFLPYVSFFLVFVLVILAMVLLAKLLEGILKITSLNSFNKVAGAAFGLLKFGLVISILLTLFKPVDARLNLLKQDVKKGSVLYLPVMNISRYIFPALGEMQKVYKEKL